MYCIYVALLSSLGPCIVLLSCRLYIVGCGLCCNFLIFSFIVFLLRIHPPLVVALLLHSIVHWREGLRPLPELCYLLQIDSTNHH